MSQAINVEQMLQDSSVRIDRHRAAKVRERLFGAAKPVAPARYELREELGRGQFGRVYLAFDRELRRKVALKVIPYESSLERARIEREAEALARISHPNVVQVYDKGSVTEGTYFLALEYVDGLRLDRWLTKETRPLKQILRVFLQIAEGLSAAHRSELVHRDFKPSNVVVGSNGRACVLDFGLAKLSATAKAARMGPAAPRAPLAPAPAGLGSGSAPGSDVLGSDHPGITISGRHRADDATSGNASYLHVSLTEAENFVGTFLYASPEQLVQPDVDPRSDQFSYCVTLFEATYGHRPFSSRSFLKQVASGRTNQRKAIRPIPRWLRKLLQRGLSPDPGDRFRDMQELAAILRDRLRPAAGLRLAIGASFVTAMAVVGSSSSWKPPEVHLALDPWDGNSIEERYGPELREQIDEYRQSWEDAAARYIADFRPDPKSEQVQCLERAEDELDRFVHGLEQDPESTPMQRDRLMPSLRASQLWLTRFFSPDQCLLDEPPQAADTRFVIFLLESQRLQLRGEYESALALAHSARRTGSQDQEVLDILDLQRGIIEARLGRSEAWGTLAKVAETATAPELRLDALAKQLEVGVILNRPSEEIRAVAAAAMAHGDDLDAVPAETKAWLEVSQGHASVDTGELDAAREHYDAAMRLFRGALQDPEQSFPIAYVELNKAFAETYAPSSGAATAARADAALTKLLLHLPGEHPDMARYTIGVGVAFSRAGDKALEEAAPTRAEEAYTRARALFETVQGDLKRCGPPCWPAAVRVRAELLSMEVNEADDDVVDARALAWRRQADALELAVGAQEAQPLRRSEVARVWSVIMQTRAMLGDYESAIDALDRWIDYGVDHDWVEACGALRRLADGIEKEKFPLTEPTREIIRQRSTECG